MSVPFTRRQLLIAAGASALAAPAVARVVPPPRALRLYHPTTKERFDDVWFDGRVVPGAQEELDWFLRDHHEHEARAMDPAMFQMMWHLSEWYRRRGLGRVWINVHSAYRTERTNETLRSEGSARNSRHLTGQAVDLSVQYYGHVFLARAGLYARNRANEGKGGGMGLYRRGLWVHLDSGPSRYWYRLR